MASAGLIVGAIAVIIILVGAVYFLTSSNNYSGGNSSSTPPSVSPYSSTASGTLFNNTIYSRTAYALYPQRDTSPQAQVVESDLSFSMQRSNATIKFASGTTYSITVPAGYKLYYIDQHTSDDSANGDSNSGDDGYAVVDQNGLIAQLNFPLPNT